jgi:hypothetical protein
MPPADANVRVPVVVLNLFQLACPAAIFCAAALHLPAVEINLLSESATGTLFGSFASGREVLVATIACTVLGLLQTAAIREPARGTARYRFGIAVAVLALVAGLVVMHGSYRVGFVPFMDEFETRPRVGAYIGLFGGGGFAGLAYVRLARFLERPATAPPAPGETN